MNKVKIDSYDYEVNELGKVFRIGNPKPKYQSVNRDGYKVVGLWKNNKATAKTVHRLVALAFIPNPENKPCVNHIDGNKQNNHVSNLEWVTYSENTVHSFENRLQIPSKGEDVGNSKYTNEQVHEICRLMQEGLRNIEIIEMYGYPKSLLKTLGMGIVGSLLNLNMTFLNVLGFFLRRQSVGFVQSLKKVIAIVTL